MGSERFEQVPVPYALPGSCFVCGGATKSWYIDFKTNIDFHGAIYLCNDCITEIAHLVGFLSPDQTKELKLQVERLETQVFELTKKEAGLEIAIGGLVAAGITGSDVSGNNGSSVVSDESAESKSQGTENQLGKGTGEASKPSEHENVGELHSNDGPESTEFSLDL